MKTKVRASYVIGYENHNHTILENAEVVYQDDRIIFVGYDYPHPVDQLISADKAVLSPGFVDLNALGDIDRDILHFQASPEIQKGLIWSEDYLNNSPHNVLNREEEALQLRYAFAQLIRNGITTAMPITSVLSRAWARDSEELVLAAKIAAELGLRVYLGPSYQSGVRVAKPDGAWNVQWRNEKGVLGLQAAVDFVREFDGSFDGLVNGFLAPERIETITPELLRESKDYSQQLGCPIRLHAAQGSFENDLIRQQYGLSPIEFLDSIGFLGPRTLIPHAIYVSGSRYSWRTGDRDLHLLAESQSSVIHCPLVMARHGLALDHYQRYKTAGVRFTMGTDTFPPDMIENIRLASLLAKVVSNDSSAGPVEDFYRAATIGGSEALGRHDLGRLAPGAKADMIIIDLSDFQVGPIDEPIKTIIYGASGKNVKTSIINGRVVMQDGQIQDQDYLKLGDRAQACFSKIKQAYSERDYLHRTPDVLFPSSFPVIRRG